MNRVAFPQDRYSFSYIFMHNHTEQLNIPLTPDQERIIAFKAEILERFSEATKSFAEAIESMQAYAAALVENLQNTINSLSESTSEPNAGNRMNHTDQNQLLSLANEAEILLGQISDQIQAISRESEAARADMTANVFEDVNRSFDKMDAIIERLTYDGRFLSEDLKIFGKGFSRFFSKSKTEEILNELIAGEIDEDEMEKKASSCFLIYTDVDGLKPMNDFAGHENGTKYLKKIVKTFLQDEQIREFAEKNALQLHYSAEGGDEFAIWGEKMNGPAGKEMRQTLTQLIRDRINAIDMDDIIDFNDKDVQANLKSKGISLPADSKIAASASLFNLGLNEAIFLAQDYAEKNDIDLAALKTPQIVKMILSQLFGKCDIGMRKDKIQNYEMMQRGSDQRFQNLYLLIQKSGRSENGSLKKDPEIELEQALAWQAKLEELSGSLAYAKDKNISYARALSALTAEREFDQEQRENEHVRKIEADILFNNQSLQSLFQDNRELKTALAQDPENTTLKKLAENNQKMIDKCMQKRKDLQSLMKRPEI